MPISKIDQTTHLALRVIIFLSFFTLLLCNSVDANIAISHKLSSDIEIKIEKINLEIEKKLTYYNQAFPNIQFVHLKNGEWEKSLQALELFIGYQATSLDYE